MNIDQLLQLMVKSGISDIHFKANTSPLIRVNGKLVKTNYEKISKETIQNIAYQLMTQEQQKIFEQEYELDFAYSVSGLARFRVNVYKQKGTISLSLRVVPLEIKSFKELNLPENVMVKLCNETRGLILIAGITGAGKTTTLNSMINYINENFDYNIITIEDPIEFYHTDKKSTISQREIGCDTKSFKNALKYVLRQDPDVVVIGEMREFEAISAGITAAETGHLVLSTIHTIDAVQTVDRIIDAYPPHQQKQARIQLSNVLKGVVAQRLCLCADGQGRIPATEVLMGTSFIRKLILENKTQELYKAMENGEYYLMYTFDQSLLKLYNSGLITYEEAMDKATNPEDLQLKLRGISQTKE
ncbi:MAG: type IV pilus twitching motility protein PilT [Endomicrobia bacterium]|nr:type IV pilus twitching motility protein PilT [Endomicrobiia bacterium]MDW8055119.1 type IV pilus twitching motility protein PilT [Elusimicrobiota bacterium]